MKKRRTRWIAWILCLVTMLSLTIVSADAAGSTTLDTDVAEPAEGNVFVAVDGTFSSLGKTEILRMLNTYRYQACWYGEKDPRNTSRNLALKDRSGGENPSDAVLAKPNGDYVPAKWSADLERIAEIRAVEASVCLDHERPNGKRCSSLKINGTSLTTEGLAWARNMKEGIELFYGERDLWVNNKSGVTGHYTSMINPDYISYGIASFTYSGAKYRWVTTALDANKKTSSNETATARNGSYCQIIEVAPKYVSMLSMNGAEKMEKDGKQTASLRALVRYDLDAGRSHESTLPVVKGAAWSSSNTKVAKVDQNGRITAVGAGTAAITATGCGKSASLNITVTASADDPTPTPTPTPTPAQPINGATIQFNQEDVSYKGQTPYVVYDGSAKTPRITVKDGSGKTIKASKYSVSYRDNTNAGTAYVTVTFKDGQTAAISAFFKIYLPAPTGVKTVNVSKGVKVTWKSVPGAKGYVVYRRAKSRTSDTWTACTRYASTNKTSYTDNKTYAGSIYEYTVKAYPTSATDNYNLGLGSKTSKIVFVTGRVLKSVTSKSKGQATVKWEPSKYFTGYEIGYSADKSFTVTVVSPVNSALTSSKTLTGLHSGVTYWFKVRSYYEYGGKTYYGAWSEPMSCTIK